MQEGFEFSSSRTHADILQVLGRHLPNR